MKSRSPIRDLPIIVAAAYLGFYFWGLLMSVFTPFELAGLTVIAVICIVWIATTAIIGRLGPRDAEQRRREAKLREKRGF